MICVREFRVKSEYMYTSFFSRIYIMGGVVMFICITSCVHVRSICIENEVCLCPLCSSHSVVGKRARLGKFERAG